MPKLPPVIAHLPGYVLRAHLLNLANNLTGTRQTLHHLLAFLSSSDGVIALLEEIIKSVGTVHVLEEFALHLILGELHKVEHDGFWNHVNHGALDNVIV